MRSSPGMILIICCLLAVSSKSVTAQQSVSRPELIRTVEGISEFRLDNGLQILLFPDVSRPTVTVNLTLFVGSRHEGYGEAGMAHLLEHMLFRGTPTHTDIPALLKQRGASFNGTTWLDRTNYYETMQASDENLEFAIQLEADRLVNSLIREEDLASEMTVVRSEFESGENDPVQVLLQRMLAVAWEWHNYGRATIGNRADIERVPAERLRQFYRKYYQPDNALLVVAGKFEMDHALDLIQENFGAIPRPERVLDTTYTEEPPQDGERLVTVRRVGDLPVVGVVYHIPAGGHPDFPAVDLLTTLMSSEPSGRLYEALVKRRLAASVSGFTFALHNPGAVLFLAEAAQAVPGDQLLQSMIEAVETTLEQPVTDEEVERARQELLRQRELREASSASVAIGLSEWAAQGDWRLYFLYRDRLEAVTPDDVQRVAAQFLVQSNRTAGLFQPTAEPQRAVIPSTPDLQAMIGDYQGRQDVAQGEAFDIDPQAIERRLIRGVLPAGIKVTLLPKKTRGAAVDLRLTLRYGSPETLQGRAMAAEFLPEMLLRGSRNLTRQQLADLRDRYRAELNTAGEAGFLTLTLKTRREHLLNTLQLAEEVLRHPTFPAEEMELLREERLAAATQQLTDPTSIAVNLVQRRLSPYDPEDPRYIPDLQESLARIRQVSREEVAAVYTKLLGSSTGELTVVGDFDQEEVRQAVDRLTTDWQSPVPFERLTRESLNNDRGERQTVQTPDKADATCFAAMTLPMREDDQDYPALAVGNFILGGGGLSSRLANRVRQQEGLSYTIQSALQPSAVDRRTVFYIYANSSPENTDKLLTAIQEELDLLLREGVTEQELQDATAGYLKQLQLRRTNDRSLAVLLEAYAFIGRDMQFVTDFERQVQQLTTDDVHAALKKHIDAKRLFVVTAGDFSGKAPVDAGN